MLRRTKRVGECASKPPWADCCVGRRFWTAVHLHSLKLEDYLIGSFSKPLPGGLMDLMAPVPPSKEGAAVDILQQSLPLLLPTDQKPGVSACKEVLYMVFFDKMKE